MSHLILSAIAFGLLFALFGVYGLSRPRQSCSGSCGSCTNACDSSTDAAGAPGPTPRA